MKLAAFQLSESLYTLASVYVLTGDDAYLRLDAETAIAKKAKQQGFSEQLRIHADTETDWQTLFFAASLFQEQQIIIVNFAEKLPDQAAQQAIITFCKQKPTDKILILHVKRLEQKQQHANWYKTALQEGHAVTLWTPKREQLPAFIMATAKKVGLQITKDAIDLLANYAEGNTSSIAATFEKAQLLKIDKLTAPLLEPLLTETNAYSVFDLADALTQQTSARTLKILHHLEAEGTEPTLILWALLRELRFLITCHGELAQNRSLDELFKKHHVFRTKIEQIHRLLRRKSQDAFLQLLKYVQQLDAMIKSQQRDSIWPQLEILCLRFHA